MPSILDTFRNRSKVIDKAAGLSTEAEAKPSRPSPKARTHVDQYSADELNKMDLDDFIKLDQD